MKNKYILLMGAISCLFAGESHDLLAKSTHKTETSFRMMAPPLVGYTYNHITCIGARDGGILVSATGAGPFTYSLDGGQTFQATNAFTGLGPGAYTVTVRDNNGETNTAGPITLTEPPVVTPLVGNDHAGSTCSNTPLVISSASLLANDSEPTGGALKIQSVTQPANGTLTENADGTLTYTPNPGFGGNDTFTYTVKKDDGTLAFSGNGHYYEFVQEEKISWTEARNAAADRTYNGLRGYLVTLTSEAENEFVKAKVLGYGWIGASDAEEEGVWKWVTGPEAGTHFSNQHILDNCSATTGTAVNGKYVNWFNNEPNNCHPSGEGEQYAHLLPSGLWNDFHNNAQDIKGYVVEYGGLESCEPILTATATVTITVGTPVARAKDISVQLGENGTATISPADVDNGSSDACGPITLSLDKTTFGIADVGANQVRLTVRNEAGNQASATATVTVVQPVLTAVKNPSQGRAGLKASPNPSHGGPTQLTFSLEKAQEYSLDLYDLTGKHVRQIRARKAEANKVYDVELQAGQLAKGLYLARLVTADRTHNLKLLVNK